MDDLIQSRYVDAKRFYEIEGLNGKLEIIGVRGYLYNYGVYFYAKIGKKLVGLSVFPNTDRLDTMGDNLVESRNMHYDAYIISRRELRQRITSRKEGSFKELSQVHILDEGNCEFFVCL